MKANCPQCHRWWEKELKSNPDLFLWLGSLDLFKECFQLLGVLCSNWWLWFLQRHQGEGREGNKEHKGQEDGRKGTEDGRKGQRMGERDRGWEKGTGDGRKGQGMGERDRGWEKWARGLKKKKNNTWNSLVVQWLGHSAYIVGTQLRCLVRELRSHMPCCMVKILKKKFFLKKISAHNKQQMYSGFLHYFVCKFSSKEKKTLRTIVWVNVLLLKYLGESMLIISSLL